MLQRQTTLSDLFAEELRLCGVNRGTQVGVLTQGRKRLAYADAIAEACQTLGAEVFHVDIPSDGAPNDGWELGVRAAATGLGTMTPAVVDAFRNCEVMVDLVFLLWSEQQAAIKSAGTRIISCVEPPATLRRLFPSPELKGNVLRALRVLERARVMRITSDGGTDVTYQLGQYGYIHQYGYADEVGRWDHFASALVGTVGNDDAVDGTVVLQPGDIIFPHGTYVSTPTLIEIRRGRITKIDGQRDALLLRDYIAGFDDADAYGISHIGWGMSPGARWDELAISRGAAEDAGTVGIGMDSRSFLGSVMFSTGPNVEFGGPNNTACHTDIPMRGCSVWLDDQLVIDHEQLLINTSTDPNGESRADEVLKTAAGKVNA